MHSFTALDYAVVVVYLAGAVALGLRFTKKQRSLEDYFVASRSAPWWAAGISVIAANFSAISFMGAPAWVYQHDLQLDFGMVVFPLQMLLVVLLFIPFLARLRLYTIYEYLEMRFGVGARTIASTLFVLVRGGHLAFAIYAQSLALAAVLHLPLTACVWVSGSATTLYTVFGGIEAVLWTDVMQFFVLVASMFVIIGAVLAPFGWSFTDVWHIASQGGHTRMMTWSTDLTVTPTIWALLIGYLVMNLSAYGSDQVLVQRYLTTGSKKTMARAVLLNGLLTVPLIALLDLMGLGFVAYYRAHPALQATLTKPDQILPHFVMNVLPSPLPGLVIAGLLAATMSTLSSGLNSLCTVTTVDFYQRFFRKGPRSPSAELWTARCFTLGWGLLLTASAMFMGGLGQIVEGSMKVLGLLSGPLLGMFLLGMLSRRANSFGVLVGTIAGTVCALLATRTAVSWLWYGPVGCFATILLGYPLSFPGASRRRSDTADLTIWGPATATPTAVPEASDPL